MNNSDALQTTEQMSMTPLAMLSQAIQSGADVDVLERLMGLQERFETRQARIAFSVALAEVRAELPRITKSKEVSYKQTNYRYEDLAEIVDLVSPVLGRHGLSFRWRTDSNDEKRMVKVTCILEHEGGYSEENPLSGPYDDSGGKNAIQSIGSVVTYLQRYTLKAALGIAAGRDDDGRQVEQPIGPELAAKFMALADSKGWNRNHVMNAAKKYHGVDHLADLTSAQAGELKVYLYERHAHSGTNDGTTQDETPQEAQGGADSGDDTTTPAQKAIAEEDAARDAQADDMGANGSDAVPTEPEPEGDEPPQDENPPEVEPEAVEFDPKDPAQAIAALATINQDKTVVLGHENFDLLVAIAKANGLNATLVKYKIRATWAAADPGVSAQPSPEYAYQNFPIKFAAPVFDMLLERIDKQ